ncbi:MAG TPA: DNA polymerase III subunit epsilon [Burkholderiales bacterium]
MPRQVVLDTETTGLHARLGDRVVEIGCVEILSRRISERQFHAYVNPEREIDEGASRVHGLTLEDLKDKPKFAEVAGEFLEFIRGAQLVIHNASFDVEFLDQELGRAKLGGLADYTAGVVDSLLMARELHPGKKNSLDALCERYLVDHSNRKLHGALLDARLLAECYLAMTRGQESLVMEAEAPAVAASALAALKVDASKLAVLRASKDETAEHERYLDAMEKGAEGPSVWRRILESE